VTNYLIQHRHNMSLSSYEVEQRAAVLTAELVIDPAFASLTHAISGPWVHCYQAMSQRLSGQDYNRALELAQTAQRLFGEMSDPHGYARAVAEKALAQYHLGQYSAALTALEACPAPSDPSCVAALALAGCVNHVGIGTLGQAIAVVQHGLQALECEQHPQRRTRWRIVLQRNLAVAYHFCGKLAAAHVAVEDAVALAATYGSNDYTYTWSLYELGLLEQRAGNLDRALVLLQCARTRAEGSFDRPLIWRWIIAAEGHTLRDLGNLRAAEERYQAGGWGEGDDGPLMLWLLQGRSMEARCAAEARLAAATASVSTFEMLNLEVFLALLDLQRGATQALRQKLEDAAARYGALGFAYHLASLQLHLAAVAYDLHDLEGGDQYLEAALRFGSAQQYFNFAWWHPQRMHALLQCALVLGAEPAYCDQLLQRRSLGSVVNATERSSVPCANAVGTETATATTLHIRCFGRFEVVLNGQLLPRDRWQGHAAGAVRMQRLLLSLARHRDPQPLEAIARYVWLDKWDHIDLRSNFHVTLAALRRVLELDVEQGVKSQLIHTTKNGYQLAASTDVAVDVEQFLDAVRRARIAEATEDLIAARQFFERAEHLYAGEFALAKADIRRM
jgi:tetratricopeptide (TPR) repeat protein